MTLPAGSKTGVNINNMNTETNYTLKRSGEPSKDRVDFRVIANGVEVHRAFLTKEGPGGYIGGMPSFIQTSEDRSKYIRAAQKLFQEQTSSFTLTEELKPYFVQESSHAYNICKRDGSKLTAFYKDQPFARENADKYCTALNA